MAPRNININSVTGLPSCVSKGRLSIDNTFLTCINVKQSESNLQLVPIRISHLYCC